MPFKVKSAIRAMQISTRASEIGVSVQIDSVANGRAPAGAAVVAQTSGRQESAPAAGQGNAPAQSNFARAMAGLDS